jgi:hypothetical protein
MAVPAPPISKDKYAGIFGNILMLNGTPAQQRAAQEKLSQLTPETAAVYAALNVIPEGELKDWLMANAFQFWKKVYQLIVGRKYTKGDYTLGERLNDQVYGNAGIGQTQVSDQMVDLAHTIFNQLFGVRIATDEDLNALDGGVDAYKARAVSRGISLDAIERAVYLKQHFYPISTYNVMCWDLKYFEIYPLVARIPDYSLDKWYTGPVLGGSHAVDGVIPISATDVLDQYLNSDFDPNTGWVTTPDGTVIKPGEKPPGASGGSFLDKLKALDSMTLIGLAAAVGYAIYEVSEND